MIKEKRALLFLKVVFMSGVLMFGADFAFVLPAVAAEDDVRVYVDEVEVAFPDQKPFINADNRTMVPIRFVSNALGGAVDWLGDTQTVQIKHEGEILLLAVGEKFASRGSERINIDTSAVIIGSRTMVPLRFVSECLGAHVYWNADKRKVFITTKLPPVNEFVGIPFKPEDLPFKGGSRPLVDSDKPSARIQYVKPSELPIKLKDDRIIYGLTVDEKNIYVKQYAEDSSPIALYMVENGKLNRNRCYYSDVLESTIFTYKYPVQSRLEQATGEEPVNLKKISGFTLHTLTKEGFKMIVVENPLYQGRD